MKNRFKRLWKVIVPIISLAMVFVVCFVTIPLLAATSSDVTITANPAYFAISNSPSTWLMNGISGDNVIRTNTTYYANAQGDDQVPTATVAADEGYFTLNNTSTLATDVTVVCGNFTGGNANMTNSDDGTNGATAYGGYSWYEGQSYASKVIMKVSGSAVLYDGLAASTDVDWGAEILTQTDDFSGSGASTATMTISIAEDT